MIYDALSVTEQDFCIDTALDGSYEVRLSVQSLLKVIQ